MHSLYRDVKVDVRMAIECLWVVGLCRLPQTKIYRKKVDWTCGETPKSGQKLVHFAPEFGCACNLAVGLVKKWSEDHVTHRQRACIGNVTGRSQAVQDQFVANKPITITGSGIAPLHIFRLAVDSRMPPRR